MTKFEETGIKQELISALESINFHEMTEVQAESIPIALQGKDLIVRSKTGSGKTGAFLVPILNMMDRRPQDAIVIVPTRELAIQVNSVAEKLCRKMGLHTVIVYGGASINIQMQQLNRGANMIIGTPGRILDLMDRGAIRLDRLRFLVLDEADLMLDMGFIEDIEKIIVSTPKARQTMLFSATMPREIVTIAHRHMKHDAAHLTVGEEEDLTVNTITHSYFIANGRLKFSVILAYIKEYNPSKAIIFTSTQRESDLLHRFIMQNGFDAILMHGGLTQAKREYALREFRSHARFLISTNLASRGLDIPNISDVINFDAPDDPHIYVHRVGRSARMGKDGRAFTIFGFEQKSLMEATSRVANVKMKHIDLNTAEFKDVEIPQATRRFNRGFSPRQQRGGDRDHGRDFRPRRSFGSGTGHHGSGQGGGRRNDRRQQYRR